MARASKQRVLTKKHLARLERERMQRRWILFGSIVVVVLVIGSILYGVVDQKVLTPLKPVARVDGQKITLKEFQGYARFTRMQLIGQYSQVSQLAQVFGSDPSSSSYFQNQLQQISAELETNTLGQNVVNALIDDRLIRAEAARRGITVTDAEIEKAIQDDFGYFPAGTPTPVPTLPVQPTATLDATQEALLATPTVIITATATPKQAPTATPTQEFTPTATQVLTPTLTPTITPTPTPYTLDAFNKNYTDVVDQYAKNNIPESVLRKAYESRLYRDKVMEAVLADLKPEEEQVWARLILVADEATAKDIETRLQKGENFASLAKQFSQDSSSAVRGGDLGWFGKGKLMAEVETAAFSMKVGEISQPIQSTYGWNIIQVLGHEIRPLTSSEFDQLKSQKFQEWLTAQKSAAKVETFDLWKTNVPTEPALPATAGQ